MTVKHKRNEQLKSWIKNYTKNNQTGREKTAKFGVPIENY